MAKEAIRHGFKRNVDKQEFKLILSTYVVQWWPAIDIHRSSMQTDVIADLQMSLDLSQNHVTR